MTKMNETVRDKPSGGDLAKSRYSLESKMHVCRATKSMAQEELVDIVQTRSIIVLFSSCFISRSTVFAWAASIAGWGSHTVDATRLARYAGQRCNHLVGGANDTLQGCRSVRDRR